MNSTPLPLPELIAAAVLLVAAVAVAFRTGSRWLTSLAGRMTMVTVVLMGIGGLALAVILRPSFLPETAVTNRPVVLTEEGYTTSAACLACHPREYHAWHRSYHRTMTQVVTPETTLGNFAGVSLELDNQLFHLTVADGRVWVDLPNTWARGQPTRRQIVLSTGSHHDQNFWMDTGQDDRALELFPFDWSIREGRWVPFRSTFLRPPDDQSEPPIGTWNTNCIHCHTTRGAPRAQVIGDTIRAESTVTEFGIACEACHGPAEEHVRAYQNPLRRYLTHLGGSHVQGIVNPAKLPAKRTSEVCGSCHGIWFERWNVEKAADPGGPRRFRPGDNVHDSLIYLQYRYLSPEYPTADRQKHNFIQRFAREKGHMLPTWFWSDGVVRVSGRDFTGLLEAPCFERGTIECTSCHQLHKAADDPRSLDEWAAGMLGAGMATNRACTQCHADLAAPAALSAHTRHGPDSSGSLCYDCHMPRTVYGIQKAIRSHTIESPNVRTSVSTGRPNGCNLCHLDQTLAWTASHLKAWHGRRPPELTPDEQEVPAGILWATRGDPGQRALVAWSMGWPAAIAVSRGSDWMPAVLAKLLEDPYDSVRFVAGHALRKHTGFENFIYDFVVSGSQQSDAALRARQTWQMRRPAPGPDLVPFLRSEYLDEVVALRPNPPFYLQE